MLGTSNITKWPHIFGIFSSLNKGKKEERKVVRLLELIQFHGEKIEFKPQAQTKQQCNKYSK